MYPAFLCLFIITLVLLHVEDVRKGRTFASERKRMHAGMLTHTEGYTQAQWQDIREQA